MSLLSGNKPCIASSLEEKCERTEGRCSPNIRISGTHVVARSCRVSSCCSCESISDVEVNLFRKVLADILQFRHRR